MYLKKIIPLALTLQLATSTPAAAIRADLTKDTPAPQRVYHALCTPTRPTPSRPPQTAPGLSPDTPNFAPPTQVPGLKPPQKPDGGTVTPQGSFAAEVLSLVNAERAKAKLPALTLSPTVTRAAQRRAQEIVRSFSHTRPNGSSFSSALSEAGASYRGAGENIAFGQRTPREVMRAWMSSPGHRANIMSRSFTTIGIGYTVVNGTPYWAQLFTY